MKKTDMNYRVVLAIALAMAVSPVGADLEASVSSTPQIDSTSSTPALEGLMEPWMDLRIGMAVDGKIEEVYVSRGEFINAGDPIARLESSVEEAQVALALATSEMRAGLDSAKTREKLAAMRAARSLLLYEEGAVTLEEMQTVQTEADLAKLAVRDMEESLARAALDLRVAEALLERRTVKSPVDGYVVERFLSPGELVNRGSQGEIVRVAQVNPLKVDVIAPLSLYGKVRVGQKALVTPENPIGGVYEASVKVVDPLVDAASGTFRIRLEVPNDDLSVPSGLRCKVQFQE